jgi:hypothetical protein
MAEVEVIEPLLLVLPVIGADALLVGCAAADEDDEDMFELVATPLGHVLVTFTVVGTGVGVAEVLVGVPTKIGNVTAVS